jgi:hypothetical protein
MDHFASDVLNTAVNDALTDQQRSDELIRERDALRARIAEINALLCSRPIA